MLEDVLLDLVLGRVRIATRSLPPGPFPSMVFRHLESVGTPFASIYRVDGTNVILSGQVVRPTLKNDAENAVKRVADIETVENKIEVLPLSPSDDRIRLATYRSIYGNTGFTRYAIMAVPPIHIIVKNADVTLVGVVSTEGDKNIANMSANTVSGVFSVKNELRVSKN